MVNKNALAQYLCAHPAFAKHLKFCRRTRRPGLAPLCPGREGEALAGFGQYKEATLKDLYDSKDKERQT